MWFHNDNNQICAPNKELFKTNKANLVTPCLSGWQCFNMLMSDNCSVMQFRIS